MRQDNLLAVRYRKYFVTTDSRHDNPVYLNLARRMTVTGVHPRPRPFPGSFSCLTEMEHEDFL